jgi:hypothetical protein
MTYRGMESTPCVALTPGRDERLSLRTNMTPKNVQEAGRHEHLADDRRSRCCSARPRGCAQSRR